MDRALHDSLCVIKRIIESNSLVAGGGAVEAALSIYLEEMARTMGSKEQLAVATFAESLLVIPRTLTVNAAHDATELVARLRAHHHKSQAEGADADARKLRFSGLDLYKGACCSLFSSVSLLLCAALLSLALCRLVLPSFPFSPFLSLSLPSFPSRRVVLLSPAPTPTHSPRPPPPAPAGEIRNNLEAGVVEPAISKIKSLRFATEAAIAILRIDDMVKLNVHKQQGR